MNVEVLKTTSNMEYDVVYADGTRRHVAEGVAYEVEGEGIIFHKGTDRVSVILACAEDILKYLRLIGPGLRALAYGMSLTEDARDVLTDIVAYGLEALDCHTVREEAAFRLGQMDMQQCAADMLDAATGESIGQVATDILHHAAALVRGMEIPGGD